jgi:hypothetical protein
MADRQGEIEQAEVREDVEVALEERLAVEAQQRLGRRAFADAQAAAYSGCQHRYLHAPAASRGLASASMPGRISRLQTRLQKIAMVSSSPMLAKPG